MNNLKDLKKLVSLCRKVGISNFKSFKDGSFEFTLNEDYVQETQQQTKKQSSSLQAIDNATKFESEQLSEEALLFWSSNAEIADKETQ